MKFSSEEICRNAIPHLRYLKEDGEYQNRLILQALRKSVGDDTTLNKETAYALLHEIFTDFSVEVCVFKPGFEVMQDVRFDGVPITQENKDEAWTARIILLELAATIYEEECGQEEVC